jgi:choline dehydrogenase-like flavoprotein
MQSQQTADDASEATGLQARTWDVLVIGTGMGGATLGYAFAKAGKSVLFCEKGRSHLNFSDALTGDWLESLTYGETAGPSAEQWQRAGRYAEKIEDISEGQTRLIQPMLGIGTGGSSALYGMTLERFFPSDFTPRRYFPNAPGANLPEEWPISSEELAPYYTKAEALYRVRGSIDPLRPAGETRAILEPPPLTSASQELFDRFLAWGLHPYRLPMACEYVAGCRECVGYICAKGCKRDSVNVCLEPALREHGAELLSECDIEGLEASNGRVVAVHGRRRGQTLRLKARRVVLAAGAVHTPALLLRSKLANGSDQVGRNLMRHLADYYLLYPETAPSEEGFLKQIAVNDFYHCDGLKLGTLQSNGRLPPPQVLASVFRERLRSKWAPLERVFPLVRPVVQRQAEKMVSGSHVMVAFLEDLPYATNRIALSPYSGRVTLQYRIAPPDLARLAVFREKIASVLRPHRFRSILRGHENRMLGHVCGTCRFGNDPRTSVLDRNNKAHELENLYVVDGSFLPTSSGMNPSLTIAANALRVAETLAAGG